MITFLSGGVPFIVDNFLFDQFKGDALTTGEIRDSLNRILPARQQVTSYLPTKQPRRKTGVAQTRREARKRRNRK